MFYKILIVTALTLLSSCWLMGEEEYTPPQGDTTSITLDCPEDCSRQVCGADMQIYCHSCAAIEADIRVIEPEACGLNPISSSTQPSSSSSSYSSPLSSSSRPYSMSTPRSSSSTNYYPPVSSTYPPTSSTFPSSASDCGCPRNLEPVCGLGTTHINSCLAFCAGSYQNTPGVCGFDSLPIDMDLTGIEPYAAIILDQATPAELAAISNAISTFEPPAGLDTMSAAQAEQAMQDALVTQFLEDPALQAILLRYMQ